MGIRGGAPVAIVRRLSISIEVAQNHKTLHKPGHESGRMFEKGRIRPLNSTKYVHLPAKRNPSTSLNGQRGGVDSRRLLLEEVTFPSPENGGGGEEN